MKANHDMARIRRGWAGRLARGPGLAGALALAAACGDIPVENELPPSGVIEGTVVYAGPLPCTQRGHVLGAALLLVFDTHLLPPPDGLGTTARSLATVPGDVLFAGVAESLPASDPGSDEIRCPPAGTPPVTVSAQWSVGPLPAATYQVRSFYDYDGDFSPTLRTHNLPTAGDVGGGALANPAAALGGAAPVYQVVEIGVRDAAGALVMPRNGALVQGLTVNLGLVLPYGRPIAHIASVIDQRPAVAEADRETDPARISLPVDARLSQSPTLHPAEADKDFVRIVLQPSVPEGERATGATPPLSLQTVEPYTKFYLTASRNPDGSIRSVPEKSSFPIADLFPQVLFARLDERDASALTAQASPAVVLNGLVTSKGLLNTTVSAWAQKNGPQAADELTVNLRPSAICLDPLDPAAPITVVTPSLRSLPTAAAPGGEPAIEDIPDLRAKIGARFGRPASQVRVVEGCLPPGQYAINLVYESGQAWTIPSEAGVCQGPLEQPGGVGCVQEGQPSRPLLASQQARVWVAGQQTGGYCAAIAAQASQAAPANGADRLEPSEYLAGVPKACLRTEETEESVRQLLDKKP